MESSKRILLIQTVFPNNCNKPDYKILREHMRKQLLVDKKVILRIAKMFILIVKNQPNLLHLHQPLIIVGDLHGQYYDALKMFELGGSPEKQKYLFLGDYIDRGVFSVQTILLLAALKINFPNTFHMLRGNHECRQLTAHFNFRQQCLMKFDQQIYDVFMDLCDVLPIACIINKKYFAVHGGLSPQLKHKQEISKINRFRQPLKTGMLTDLLWSDPVSEANKSEQFSFNSARGCSYFFGPVATKSFLQQNHLVSIIRAHEAQLTGFKLYRWGTPGQFPTVITVFSAPNYCDSYGNQAAIIKFNNNSASFIQFHQTPHPFVLPNFMNVFNWSFPFIAEKVSQIFLHILEKADQEEQQTFNELTAEKIAYMKKIMQGMRKSNQKILQKEPTTNLNEQQFEKKKKNDIAEYHPQFGPKIYLNPLKINLEDDDQIE